MTEAVRESAEQEEQPAKYIEVHQAEEPGALRIPGHVPIDVAQELNGLTLPVLRQEALLVRKADSLTSYDEVDFVAVDPREIARALAESDRPHYAIYWSASADRLVYFDGQQDVEGEVLIRAEAGRVFEWSPTQNDGN